ncbi:MAG TPA: hypothetical protein PK812_09625, partial [Beijerinckiaceae bacterium]|nr:hypothetical protein [Beijerinckiaceae bacterium]
MRRALKGTACAALMVPAGLCGVAAEDLVRPFAPVETATVQRSVSGSIFGLSSASSTVADKAVSPGLPLDITPSQAALTAAAAALAAAPKPANVPLPPRVERAGAP